MVVIVGCKPYSIVDRLDLSSSPVIDWLSSLQPIADRTRRRVLDVGR